VTTSSEPLIRNIADTARWVAVYRARETERPDALFRDPYARRLAGERGEEIDAAMARRSRQDWPFVIRTFLFDSLIAEHVRNGGDMVVNLAAGLDARPYRMDLPASLRWVEVDLPEILDYKEGVLREEKSRCALRRVRLDLRERSARRKLFAELGGDAKNALVVTEGLMIYLSREQAVALAEDLAAPSGFRRWILDLTSPGLRQMLERRIGDLLAEAGERLQFAPEEGPHVFEPQGWKPVDVRSYLKWAAKKRRIPWWLRVLATIVPQSNGRQGRGVWAATCMLGKAAG
jgi:methyltransferase (TIGR00027 family)